MTSDPTRLLDDPTAAPALRDDLLHATQAELHGLDLAAGLATLQHATSGPAAVAGMSRLTKLGLGAAVTGGAVALWLGLGGPNPPPPTPQGPGPMELAAQSPGAADDMLEPSTKPTVTAVPEEAPEPEPQASEPHASEPQPEPEAIEPQAREPQSEPQAIEPQPEPQPDARTARSHHDAAHHDPAPGQSTTGSEVDDVLREARLVAKARSKLAKDPSGALALTAEAEREFPRGQLVEERQALAIRALVALGRTEEARRRAEPFLATYGRSAHAAAVRRSLSHEP